MKNSLKVFLLMCAALSLVFAGCSNDSQDNSNNEEASETTQESAQVNVENEDASEDSGVLTEVGQVVKDSGATYELVKIKNVNQTVDVAPVKMILNDMKIIKMTNISAGNEDYLLQFTDDSTLPDEVNYLQIDYVIENTEDKDVGFDGIDTLVLNTGEQYNVSATDFILENNSTYTYYGKVKHEGAIGIMIKGDPADVTSVKLITDKTYDGSSYDTITESQRVDLQF